MIESLLVLAILVAAVLYVLWPLLGAGTTEAAAASSPPADTPPEELETALVDLEYDLRAGKLPADSYAELKEQLQRRLRESR